MMALFKHLNEKMEQYAERAVHVSALRSQEGGDHYKKMNIQPAEFIHENRIPYLEGCAIKYLCRHRDKGGAEDLRKAKHYIDIILDLEYKAR